MIFEKNPEGIRATWAREVGIGGMFPTDRRHSKRKGSKVLLCVEMLKKYNEVNVAGTE